MRIIDNNGIGALYATFRIREVDGKPDFAPENVGAAVSLTGNNEIGRDGWWKPLLGRLEHVGGNLATVQIKGVARLNYAGARDPAVGCGLYADGKGAATWAATWAAIGRGLVIAVDAENHTCDVLL